MEVSTKDFKEVDKTIKVSIMLAQDVQSADLNSFQLRVRFLDGESISDNRLQYRNKCNLGKQPLVTRINKNELTLTLIETYL
ncbi:hypothetical protein Aasi_0988 [Candidatus Amoebophilus asiaticus 5a2]|uniref:Uncharacterized protein n=1 Tax=Amoebophilus asiaticus (strain 5a2) TaxID=452471 RepID=B3ESZ1_AMOA5|nr:hypothetical protein [Candidatus Amoebophilus asiaticus]ACE06343.1 hypothetical protein Aasi_0988 [Candidatus Amoebophilus asiaticus 5a2]